MSVRFLLNALCKVTEQGQLILQQGPPYVVTVTFQEAFLDTKSAAMPLTSSLNKNIMDLSNEVLHISECSVPAKLWVVKIVKQMHRRKYFNMFFDVKFKAGIFRLGLFTCYHRPCSIKTNCFMLDFFLTLSPPTINHKSIK